ncbi:hypothetical protein VTO42DRAFT_299 [Malbranchea cinnamomea]
MSVLVLYRRVITGVARPLFIRVVNAMLGTLVMYLVVYVFLIVFQCRPPQAYWLQYTQPPGSYEKSYSGTLEGPIPFSNAVVSCVTDFITAILPIFLFWQLNMPFREKLALSVLFGDGFIACAMGIVRAVR